MTAAIDGPVRQVYGAAGNRGRRCAAPMGKMAKSRRRMGRRRKVRECVVRWARKGGRSLRRQGDQKATMQSIALIVAIDFQKCIYGNRADSGCTGTGEQL